MTGAASVSPFRLFGRSGRADRTPPGGPDPWLDDPPAAPPPAAGGSAPGRAGGPGAAVPDDGPATAAARPAAWTPRRPPVAPQPDPDPVTDPFGFPPVPPPSTPPAPDDVAAAWAAWAPAGPGPVLSAAPSGTAPAGASERVPSRATGVAGPAGTRAPATVPGTRPDGPVPPANPAPLADPVRHPGPAPRADPVADAEPVTRAEAPAPARPVPAGEPVPTAGEDPTASPDLDAADAASLAGAFAADLLSWDEDDPARRGHALSAHLADPAAAGLLGWTGTGRQRADLVLPGRVRPGADGRVHVDVRVRVVPYRRVDARGAGSPEPAPEQPLGEPAAAPAASARGWRGLAARWMRVEVTVVRNGDRLVVDAGPEPEPDPPPPSPRDLAARRRPS